MSFRLRLTLLASLAVAAAVVGTSVAVYYTDRAELMRQVDSDLNISRRIPALKQLQQVYGVERTVGPHGFTVHVPTPQLAGKLLVLPGSATAVRVTIARQRPPTFSNTAVQRFTTKTIGGVRTRVLTFDSPSGTITVSRSLQDIDRNLAHLRWLLVFVSLGGIGAAALLGALVSGRALAPLRRLTEATERIVETGDLSKRTGQRGRDEISRLSARLDELLGTLDESLKAQRQLVADASHELRTPIATLRANVDLLADPGALGPVERSEMLVDVREELESMTTLIGELVELARGEERDVVASEFRLDEIVQQAVDRARRRTPGISFQTELEPSVVTGVPERVERAVANLLDNARKWSPAGETVAVTVRDGAVEVRDHGPGIDDEDLPLVFNRFYRSARARGMPGAGLGLAIVKQIADAHGGGVTIDRPAGGGAAIRLQLSPTG